MNNQIKQIGLQIKAIRKAQGLTQKDLQLLCDVSSVTIAVVESGSENYSLRVLSKIVTALGCKLRFVIE